MQAFEIEEKNWNLNETKKIEVKGDDLTTVSILSYSIGHFLNDICASCWFNFLSYYLVNIRMLSPMVAGYVLFAGQISDAIATPLVGYYSDHTNTRFGKRTPWYVCGTLLSIVTFILIFQDCIFCGPKTTETNRFIYYLINPSLFNIGWAMVQVSHMALLPSISLSKKKQDYMTRMRTGFTFGSQLTSLLLSLVIFYLIEDKFTQYSVLTLLCVGLGIIASTIFLIYCREVTLSKNMKVYYSSIKDTLGSIKDDSNQSLKLNSESFNSEQLGFQAADNQLTQLSEEVNIRYWLRKPEFYLYMLVYMFVRLAINVSSSMIPFYCKNILGWKKEDGSTPIEISIVLIITNTGSVFNSVYLESMFSSKFSKLNQRISLFILASLTIALGCFPIYSMANKSNNLIYYLSFFFGIGFSAGLSGATALINDVVGSNGEKGAFVYGCYSFSDKLSCGIALFYMIQIAESNTELLRVFMSFFPPFSIVTAFLLVILRKLLLNSKQKEELSKSTISLPSKSKKKSTNYGSILDDSRLTFK